jgi:Tol biopolymer transport system component
MAETADTRAKVEVNRYLYAALAVLVISAPLYILVSTRGGGGRVNPLYSAAPAALMPTAVTAAGANPVDAQPRVPRVRPLGSFTPQKAGALPAGFSFPEGVRTFCFAREAYSPKRSVYPYKTEYYIYLMDATEAALTRLFKGRGPAISPDGKLLAFSEEIKPDELFSPRRLRLADLETNRILEIEPLANTDASPIAWSHDGTKLVFNGPKGMSLALLDVKSWEVTTVIPDTAAFNTTDYDRKVYFDSWAPDDKSFLCHSLNTVYEVGLDGKIIWNISTEELTQPLNNSISSEAGFMFTPDKRQLLYNGTGPDCGDIEEACRTLGAYRFDLADKTLARITPEYLNTDDVTFLPSGDEILYAGSCGYKQNRRVPNLCKIPLAGGTPTLLIKNVWSYSYAVR